MPATTNSSRLLDFCGPGGNSWGGEHDEATMRRADHVVDLDRARACMGGRWSRAELPAELMRHRDSITGRCLRAPKRHLDHPRSPAAVVRKLRAVAFAMAVSRERTPGGMVLREAPVSVAWKEGRH
ncbi:MAG: hypothetical protein U1G07_04625 [Verrucomicrobiota bacterium]